MNELKKDIYSRVTDRIIDDLEKGVRSWLKPWSAQHPAGSICDRYARTGRRTGASTSCCCGAKQRSAAFPRRSG
jgi:antirestriction protein ArdC